jgi:hypothetical protein
MLKIKLALKSCLLIGVSALNSGCGVPMKPIPMLERTDAIYIVKKGDTLNKISQEATGSQDNAKAIAD